MKEERLVPYLAPITPDLICGGRKSRCLCYLSPQHEGPHICQCEGSWDDAGIIYSYPKVIRPQRSSEEYE